MVSWSPSPVNVLKFKCRWRVARDKPGSADIGGVLHNSKGEILLMFSKSVGVESNEAE